MHHKKSTNILIRSKLDGNLLGVAGGNYRIIIDGETTGNAYSVIEMKVPPGGGPPPHAHPLTQESFYVLEGAVTFKTEVGATLLRKGDLVSIPLDGGVHCFENTTTDLATLLCTFMPAGLEKIFYHLGEPVGPDEFLALPERSKEREELHKALDLLYNQKTFPRDHLDI